MFADNIIIEKRIVFMGVMAKKHVLLLMSGGVDSSVAGAMLLEQGYNVVGVTMKQLDVKPTRQRSGGCCSFGDVRDAKRVAAHLGIPHYTINTAEAFHRQVIVPFIRSYQAGLTPNPCVYCNSFVRFEEAMELGRQWDCEYAATGHYARVESDGEGAPHLYRAVCREKDQSYFLYGVRRELLKTLLFPLGGLKKEEVRSIAGRLNLATAEKADSQEICFTLGRSYHEFLSDYMRVEKGPIRDRSGNCLGEHKGAAYYTVGQRQGLGLSGGPYYVCAIDPQTNTLIVGRKEELAAREVRATAARWIHEPKTGERVFGQIRSRHRPAAAIVGEIHAAAFALEFEEAQYGAAPGQALVVSRGDEIIGGGTIQR
ncbi:MAG: tRNA 2-thiouridine(34) synthase MnmA [Candidatus Omnitrophota bacterium]|nr:MAG: tRNA 2-thiouridine(34) synthase MnmA [Candidatus Omnitrophota bacterium]